MVSPVTVAVRFPLDQLAVWPPGFVVTVYPVIVEPPVDAGGFQLTEACVLPAVAETLVGAPGTVAGVTVLEGVDALLPPTLLVAMTVNVYAVPLIRPVTVAVRVPPDHVAVWPPGLVVTV